MPRITDPLWAESLVTDGFTSQRGSNVEHVNFRVMTSLCVSYSNINNDTKMPAIMKLVTQVMVRINEVVRLTALVFNGDVEVCLQRLQWIPCRLSETERSSGWQLWYSLETLKLVFNVSSEYPGFHPDDLSVSVFKLPDGTNPLYASLLT